jgi:DNA-damage-inducible protein J
LQRFFRNFHFFIIHLSFLNAFSIIALLSKNISCVYLQLQANAPIIKQKGGDTMANTSAVYARIDTDLKHNAEGILAQLGITPSSAIQMLYSQIVLQKGMPFDLRLPASKPSAVSAMTKEQLDAELQKGVDAIKEGKVYSADEVDAALKN